MEQKEEEGKGEKRLFLEWSFKDDCRTNWKLKICPRGKIELGNSRISVSDENAVLVMKKVRLECVIISVEG